MPGILTGIAAILTAIGGVFLALHTAGYFDNNTPTPVDIITSEYTPTDSTQVTPTPGSTSTKPEINIIYPLDLTKAQWEETVKGTAKNIPEGQQLWIVVLWYTVYYPQNYVVVQSDGSWELPIEIGEPRTFSNFEILAVLADKNAQNKFNNYFNTFEKTGVYPEMTKLPDGSKVKAKASVGRV